LFVRNFDGRTDKVRYSIAVHVSECQRRQNVGVASGRNQIELSVEDGDIGGAERALNGENVTAGSKWRYCDQPELRKSGCNRRAGAELLLKMRN